MGVNNTSLPTPCGQGWSTIWPGDGRWLGTPPHHRQHFIAPRHWERGTWLGIAAEVYKLFIVVDQMSFKFTKHASANKSVTGI